MSESIEQQLQELMNREREIIKKMNIAIRAQANPQILNHFDFMLNEVRVAQQELRFKQKTNGGDEFSDYISIG